MFRFFKRWKRARADIDESSQESLALTAELLRMQLALCSKSLDESHFPSNFFRGYIYGFFDASIQHACPRPNDDIEFASMVLVGYALLLGDPRKAEEYFSESMTRLGDKDFQGAQMQGGNEYISFMRDKRSPMGLTSYVHDL